MRYMLTDEPWAIPHPPVHRAEVRRGGQRPDLAGRQFFEAVPYWARAGTPWRDLPAECGRWDAVDHRSRRWVAPGGLRRLLGLSTDRPDLGDVRRVRLDAATVRAHRRATGARRGNVGGRRRGRPRRRASAAAAAG